MSAFREDPLSASASLLMNFYRSINCPISPHIFSPREDTCDDSPGMLRSVPTLPFLPHSLSLVIV